MTPAARLLALSLVAFVVIITPFTQYMRNKPFVEKVGYTPQPAVLKATCGDQQFSLAAGLILKILFYYGTLVEKKITDHRLPPDHETMYRNVVTATRLDPYNMDSYYFAQAMAWDFKNIRETNALLEYGIQYRSWDFYLPFFAGFNYGYFLKDYGKAAFYFQKAQTLSGADIFGRLASRYLYEAGQTELAIGYLETMVQGSRHPAIRQSFARRLTALKAIRRIELARDKFRQERGSNPPTLETLYAQGFLNKPVIDPYGGQFYLDPNGMIRSTSKLAGGSNPAH